MPLDYTAALARVIDDVARTLPDLAYVRADALQVSLVRARTRTLSGAVARTEPRPGRSPLYHVRFYFPRFHDQPFEDKIVTILHELWHIAPECDGRLRRFTGRTCAHGRSRAAYDAHLAPLARAYIRQRRGHPVLDFLELSTEDLARYHGLSSTAIPRARSSGSRGPRRAATPRPRA